MLMKSVLRIRMICLDVFQWLEEHERKIKLWLAVRRIEGRQSNTDVALYII